MKIQSIRTNMYQICTVPERCVKCDVTIGVNICLHIWMLHFEVAQIYKMLKKILNPDG